MRLICQTSNFSIFSFSIANFVIYNFAFNGTATVSISWFGLSGKICKMVMSFWYFIRYSVTQKLTVFNETLSRHLLNLIETRTHFSKSFLPTFTVFFSSFF